MANKNITYLFGAGASANALPVVSNMKNRMKLFMNFINSDESRGVLFKGIEREMGKVVEDFKEILDQALVHSTPDTFAKKLALKGEKQKLNTLKFFLSTYLLFEQMGCKLITDNNFRNLFEELPEPNLATGTSDRIALSDKISKVKDYRYDVFYATLLIKIENKIQLPKNINILSWNYDLQFELSYCDFDIENKFTALKNLNIFPFEKPNPESGNIIKLNGVGGLFSNGNNEGFVLIENNNLIQIINDLFRRYSAGETIIPFLNFAWELRENEISNNAVKYAKEIIQKTDVLVIIGYSFPNFNKQIDLEIFGDKVFEKIYYQAPSPEVEDLAKSLKWFLPKVKDKIVTYPNVDQFFIPPEFIFPKEPLSRGGGVWL